jgi:hypothetical protein
LNLNNNITNSFAIVVSSDSSPRTRNINLSLATYLTAEKVKNKALDNNNNKGFKLKDNITTNSSDNSKPDFNDLDDNIFDLRIRGDYNVQDDFIDVD